MKADFYCAHWIKPEIPPCGTCNKCAPRMALRGRFVRAVLEREANGGCVVVVTGHGPEPLRFTGETADGAWGKTYASGVITRREAEHGAL